MTGAVLATSKDAAATGAQGSSMAGKYLTFHLAGEIYGLPILKVQEIIRMMKITRVPRAPGFVLGVINLRGKVIPIINMRAKFGIETVEDWARMERLGLQDRRGDIVDTLSGGLRRRVACS